MRNRHSFAAVICCLLMLAVLAPSSVWGERPGNADTGEASDISRAWRSTISEIRAQLDAIINRAPCARDADRRLEGISRRVRDLELRLEHLSDLERMVDAIGDLAPHDQIRFKNRLRNLAEGVERLADRSRRTLPTEAPHSFASTLTTASCPRSAAM